MEQFTSSFLSAVHDAQVKMFTEAFGPGAELIYNKDQTGVILVCINAKCVRMGPIDEFCEKYAMRMTAFKFMEPGKIKLTFVSTY